MPLDKSIWIRVTVTCGDDEDGAWHFTLNTDEDPCLPVQELISSDETVKILDHTYTEKNIHYYPNPAENTLNVNFKLFEEKSKVEIHLIDLTGKIVHQIVQKKFGKGEYFQSFDISTLQSGYYFVKTKINDDLITKSLIKL